MQEYLDVLNEKGEKTGERVTYEEAHKKGIPHRVVHVWILNATNKHFLLQKRNSSRRAYPNHWDMSAAGHVSAGETSVEAALREAREEIGITLAKEDLCYLFTIDQHLVLNEGTFVAHDIQDVFLVHKDINISQLMLGKDEVEELRWVGIDEFKEWIAGRGEVLVPHAEEYRRILEIAEAA